MAAILAAYGVGLLAQATAKLLASGYYGLQDTRTPVRIAIASLALGILRGGWAGIAVAGGFALVYLGLVFTPAPEGASDVPGRLWRSEPVLVAGVALLAAAIVASYIARPLDVVNRLWRAHRALLVGGLVVLSSLVVVLAYLLLA